MLIHQYLFWDTSGVRTGGVTVLLKRARSYVGRTVRFLENSRPFTST